MTIGERIAALRKQLGLSQEGLGEKMGVSRQSISKWEADASLPEIEKLVAMSRLFGVSVGYLLGVEEDSVSNEEATDAAPTPEELTEQQLHMVEEIVKRYTEALPKPKKRPRWHYALAGVAIGCALLWLSELYDNIDRLNHNYVNLSNNLNNVQNSVYYQIDAIGDRVEEILHEQNDLLANKSMRLHTVDIAKETATFSFSATPRRFEDGMVAYVLVENDGKAETFGPYEAEGQTFTGEFTTALTNYINASVVLEKGDVRETQALGEEYNLYALTLPPSLKVSTNMWGEKAEFGKPYDLNGTLAWVQDFGHDSAPAKPVGTESGDFTVTIESMRLGLFIDKKLVLWAEPCEKPANYRGFDAAQFYRFPEGSSFTLEEGETFYMAAVAVDNYGREFVQTCYQPLTVEDGMFSTSTETLLIEWDYAENWEY